MTSQKDWRTPSVISVTTKRRDHGMDAANLTLLLPEPLARPGRYV